MTVGPPVVLLDFDGTCYRGDLPVQAYARRMAELVTPEQATTVIGVVRAFLESKPLPDGSSPAVTAATITAEDGYEVVHALADLFEVTTTDRRAAYRSSREDFARSAFVLDPEPGIGDWLRAARPAEIWLVTNAPITGVREVLAQIGLTDAIDRFITDAGKPAGLQPIAESAADLAGGSDRIVGIGDRWHADLAGVATIGGRTAQLDRYGRRIGSPTWRAADFDGLRTGLDTLIDEWRAS